MKTQFINELNNLIKLEIKNYKDKQNFIGVKIILEGPNSISENEFRIAAHLPNLFDCVFRYK